MTENEKKLEELKTEKDKFRDLAFLEMIKIFFVFAVPAALAFWLGTKLDKNLDKGHFYVLIFLGIAFVLSWVMVIFIYKKLNTKMKKNEVEIADLVEKVQEERVEKMTIEEDVDNDDLEKSLEDEVLNLEDIADDENIEEKEEVKEVEGEEKEENIEEEVDLEIIDLKDKEEDKTKEDLKDKEEDKTKKDLK
jgi:uncharacterized membrane protein (DUF485 family)